jgi:hypothetical protein
MECNGMKISELIRIIEQYDPSSDILIAGKPNGYRNFKIEKHANTSTEKGGLPIVAIEATEDIGLSHVIIEE